MLRLGCLGDLLRFEKREIEVAAFAPDRSSPQSNRGDEAERTGSVGEGAGAPDPTWARSGWRAAGRLLSLAGDRCPITAPSPSRTGWAALAWDRRHRSRPSFVDG